MDFYSDAENEILKINGLTREWGFELYPYQEEYIKHIYSNNCVCAIKARCTGYSTAYLLHSVFLLHKTYKTGKEAYDNCTFVAVLPNEASLKRSERFLNQVLRMFDDADFAVTAMKHYRLLTPGMIRTRMIGFPRREITELYLDEYAYFPEDTDLSLFDYSFIVNKLIGATTLNKGVSTAQEFINKFSKGHPDTIFTPWYECPKFNKNLKWERLGIVQREPTIDDNGNVEYDREKWRKMISEFWNPTNEWFEEFCHMELPTTEQELNCKNGQQLLF